MKQLISIIIFWASCTIASASTTSGDGKITQFYTASTQNFVRVEFNQPIKQLDCEAGGYYIAELDESESSSRYYSALLAAYLAQKNVSFWVSGCTNSKYWGSTRPKIFDIYIEQ